MEEIKKLNDDMVEQATGGADLREDPLYNRIKEIYIEKGIRTASALASHYFDDATAVAIMKLINQEVG